MQTALIIAAASGVAIPLFIWRRRARATLARIFAEPIDQVNFIGLCYRCLTKSTPGSGIYCDTCRPIVDANPAEPIEKRGDAK